MGWNEWEISAQGYSQSTVGANDNMNFASSLSSIEQKCKFTILARGIAPKVNIDASSA